MGNWFKIGLWGMTLFGIDICWFDLWTKKWGLEIGWHNNPWAWLCIGFRESNPLEETEVLPPVTGTKPVTLNGIEIEWIPPFDSEVEPDGPAGRYSEEKLDELVELIRRT